MRFPKLPARGTDEAPATQAQPAPVQHTGITAVPIPESVAPPLTSELTRSIRFSLSEPRGYYFEQVETFVQQVIEVLAFYEQAEYKWQQFAYEMQLEVDQQAHDAQRLRSEIELFKVQGSPLVNADGSYVTESQTSTSMLDKVSADLNLVKDQLSASEQSRLVGQEEINRLHDLAAMRDQEIASLRAWGQQVIADMQALQAHATTLEAQLVAARQAAAQAASAAVPPTSSLVPSPAPTVEPTIDPAPVAVELVAVEPVAVDPVAVEPVAVEPVAVEPVAVEPVVVEVQAPVDATPVASIGVEVAMHGTETAFAEVFDAEVPMVEVGPLDGYSEDGDYTFDEDLDDSVEHLVIDATDTDADLTEVALSSGTYEQSPSDVHGGAYPQAAPTEPYPHGGAQALPYEAQTPALGTDAAYAPEAAPPEPLAPEIYAPETYPPHVPVNDAEEAYAAEALTPTIEGTSAETHDDTTHDTTHDDDTFADEDTDARDTGWGIDSELPEGVTLPGTGEAAYSYPAAAPGAPLETHGVPVGVWAPELDPRITEALAAEATQQAGPPAP